MEHNKNKFWLGLCVGILIGALCFFGGVMTAKAESAQTTVTVVIQDEVSVSASVPCNEVNCTETVDQTVSVGWWGRFTSWVKNLF